MFSRLFFIVFLFFYAHAYSSSNISKVPCASSLMTIEAVNISDKINISLNNGTTWSCTYTDLFDEPYGWHLGDRVHIIYVYSEGYYLQNASCEGCVPVKLQNRNATDLKVTTIKEIIKNEKKSTNTLILEDGTRWFVGSWSSAWMPDWQPGDRIIVTEQEFMFGNADHLLLNLDRVTSKIPENVRAQLLSSLDKIIFEDFNKRETRNWNITINSISRETDCFIIKLNNKTIWKYDGSKLDALIGDELEFYPDDDEEWELLNGFSQEIELPIIYKISSDKKEILLSDHSVWFSRKNEFSNWQQGDRIIVSSLSDVYFDTSTHILLNIDISKKEKNIKNYNYATFVK